MSEKINSREYWNIRFAKDWNEYAGSSQTEFFAKLACNMIPDWLVRKIKANQYTICDIGCAQGEGVNILAEYFKVDVSGIDFSEEAIKIAQEAFPQYHFTTGDISNLPKDLMFDVIFCSNVLEHFSNPWKMLKKMSKIARHYMMIMVPFREKLEIIEHEYKFDSDRIPIEVENYRLVYLDTVDGKDIDNTFYPDKQILLIYSSVEDDIKAMLLNDLTEGVSKASVKDSIAELNLKHENIENEFTNKLKESENKLTEYQLELENCRKEIDQCKKEISLGKEELQKQQNECNDLKIALDGSKKELAISQNKLQNKDKNITAAIYQSKMMLESRLYKMFYFMNRFLYQGIKGNGSEKKKFIKWFFSCIRGGGDADRRFNPMFSVINILEQKSSNLVQNFNEKKMIFEGNDQCALSKHLQVEDDKLNQVLSRTKTQEALKIEKIINEREYKGILIYPHVVYWEPLQTPQQLLRAFAKRGWLCFFCEHPSVKTHPFEIEPNLFITYETDLLMALGNKQVTVLLTWLGSMSFVNKIENKKIWYHILDKLDIFPYYDDFYLNYHNKIIEKSDYVSYVAKPLTNCIINRNDAIYLPNGSNPDELLNIHEGFVPEDMKAIVNKKHKIIGYYGYLAEWMDYRLVAEVAKARPDYEFVFIGKAIHDTSLIDNIPNVHLLGLKPYKELSDYAKLFDVATIPFLINDMMDCVSPIKFYEYCALGLPVITSYMKEMELFTNDYIAYYKNMDEYLFYLDKFVQNEEVKLLAKTNGPTIAKNNTWLSRADKMISKFDLELRTILNEDYSNHDVIILSVIDYDFRYQRPQHFASRYAKNGHRVFYVNANHYKATEVNKIEKNLFVVNFHNDDFSAIHLTDWNKNSDDLFKNIDELFYSYSIRDAIVIVDYPNWINAATYIRRKYGCKIVTDYMDDFTGFINPAENLVAENCVKLLKKSDLVIASSQFLYDIAEKYNSNVAIVRNGTEFDHFYKAAKCSDDKERNVVGYYGAVAHWFDVDKVCYVAENLPDCDIIVIGDVTEGRKKMSKYSNIKLLGEMPYSEIPSHLAYFDVCLIPFDTSTDLIKATNPVKFYEYLSAGKKVVATEIPELEPFKDKYVYMSNDNKKFLEYIKACLNGTDSLASSEECIQFGKENDWQKRFEDFSALSMNAVPKVSIIVLTYNNLKLNKLCIDSILTKTAYPNYELIIVDNNSTDGTKDYLLQLSQQNIPNLKVVLNEQNKGFAGGNNLGIKESTGDYVLLLNNDTIVTRGWLSAMVRTLENDKSLGMCGPVTNSIGNEAKICVNYSSINELHDFAYRYTWDHFGEQFTNINMLALFCTLIKREVIDKCGLLDESYEVGMFEDDDYSDTVKAAGYKITISEDSFIHHFEGASFKKLEDEKFRDIFEVNKDRYEKKWSKTWKVQGFREGVNSYTNLDIKFDI